MLEPTDRRSRQFQGLFSLLAVLLAGVSLTGCKTPGSVSDGLSTASGPSNGPDRVDGSDALADTNAPGFDPDTLLFDEIQRIQGEVLAGRAMNETAPSESNQRRIPDFEQGDEAEPLTTAVPVEAAAARDAVPGSTVSMEPAVSSIETQPSETAVQPGSDSIVAALVSGANIPAALKPTPGTMDPQARYIRSLLESASLSDTPLRHHLTLAIVLGMTSPDQAFEPEGLTELTDQEQELVRVVHGQFKSLGGDLDEGGDSEAVLQHLRTLIDLIRTEDTFRINRLALCTRVRDFGVIDAVEPPVFDPNERSSFIWYLELDGFKPDHDPDKGTWAYEFDLKLEMLTRDTGVPVIAPLQSTVRHNAGSEVRDFYLRDLFKIPSTLQFDWYTTKLTVIDRKSGAQAQQSADFLWVPNLEAGVAHMQRQAVVPTSE